MPKLFQDWQREIAPRWLRAGKGEFWLKAMGATKDRVEQWTRDLLFSRFPDYGGLDAVQQLSGERGLEAPFVPGMGQVDLWAALPAWRSKVKQALARWAYGGTGYGVLRELRSSLVGMTDAKLRHFTQLNPFVLSVDGDSGVPEDDADQLDPGNEPGLSLGWPIWNQFVVLVLIEAGHLWHPGPLPGDTSSEANMARRIINRWRAAHALNTRIIVQNVGATGYDALWGLNDGTGDPPQWGGGLTWGATGGAGSETMEWSPPSPQ